MTGLRWCPGCQANVRPDMMGQCPRCGTSVRPPQRIPTERRQEVGLELEEETEVEAVQELEIQLEEEGGLELEEDDYEFELPDLDTEPVKTPMSGRLVLNPKVKDSGINPLCPHCEEPIRRLDGGSDDFPIVEFRCGCEELRYFEFEEVDSE